MAKINYCFVICALLAASALSDQFPPEPRPETTSAPTSSPITSTTAATNTTINPPLTTPSTSTTPETPTTKTTPPTTPTTKTPPTTPTTKPPPTTPTTKPPPTTPTTKPPLTTTTKTTTSTTTPKPSTTTKAPPKPTPTPIPGTWHVNYPSSNKSCILLKMAAIIDFPCSSNNNKTEEGQLIISDKATASGTCGNGTTTQVIDLSWAATGNETNKNQSISLTFEKNGTKFDLTEISVNITMDNTTCPDAKELHKVLVHVKKEFVTPLKNSYKCDKTQTLNLTDKSNNITQGTIKIQDLQFQAFHNDTAITFAEALDCEPYETPDIVPIAVGCALAALIVIVLITYLIGRRRNQARGYLSM